MAEADGRGEESGSVGKVRLIKPRKYCHCGAKIFLNGECYVHWYFTKNGIKL